MQTILYNISQIIGVAIIHSMWQGLLVYLLLRVVLGLSPNMSSAAKHNVAFTALMAITAWFVFTLSNEINTYTWVALKPDEPGILPAILGMPIHGKHVTSFSDRYYYTIEGFLPYITIIYIAGFLFNTTKLVWARKKINSIRQSMSIEVQLQLKVDQFVKVLNMRNKVQFGMSKMVDIPCMVGYFKPVVLLPFTLATYLSAEEIEIIILHELAHIKRNDYLINLAQQAMSVLLFFNPFAQLIDRTISKERENSCDDIVIEATQKPLVYAHALLKVEQTRQHEWQLALAATGKKYHLLNRIERIMKTNKPIGNTRHILLAIVLLTASITGLAWLNPTIANGKISINKIKPAIISALFDDTTTHKKTVKTSKALTTTKKPVKSTHSYAYTSHSGNHIYVNDHNFHYGDGFDDPELNKLSAEVEKYGDVINKYYESPGFKKLQEQMDEISKKMDVYYSNPDLKKLQDRQNALSEDFNKKWGDDGETSKMSEKMGEIGQKIEKYYSSDEFKQMNTQLEKKYGINPDKYYDDRDDENYKKYEAELETHISPEIKQQTEDLKKMGKEMRDHFNSPDRRRLSEEMRAMGDSMRRAYNNPEIKGQQAEMRKLGEQMRNFQNSPEIKQAQADLRAASEKMRAYTHTPAFKKRMEIYKYSNGWSERSDDSERPEKPEKPDKPEAPDTTKN